jgi:cellobiose PTS system EIIB component
MSDQPSPPKMIRALMVCAMGMSSSLLEIKIKEAAAKAGVPFELKAVAVQEITRWDPLTDWRDIILIAPQVFYKKNTLTAAVARHGILVESIEPTVFGMVDGEAVFKQIMAAVKARDEAKAKDKK